MSGRPLDADTRRRRAADALAREHYVRKRSGFKEYSANFWINERGKTGCRYQCKHCGKITLGWIGDGTGGQMHWSTCPIWKMPQALVETIDEMRETRREVEIRPPRPGDGTSCNGCTAHGEVAAVMRVGRNETRFCAGCLEVLCSRLASLGTP